MMVSSIQWATFQSITGSLWEIKRGRFSGQISETEEKNSEFPAKTA